MISLEKIRWSKKVPPFKIRRLYESDASGQLDEELVDEVGIMLYARCESISLVSRAQVRCPRCRALVEIGWDRSADERIHCPTAECGWQTTHADWHRSWTKRQLIGSNALPLFETYLVDYAQAETPGKKMLLIDALIHDFHHDLETQQLNRSVANNLIEGSHGQVIALLDGITYGPQGTPGLAERQAAWRENTERMLRRRRGVRDSTQE